MWLDWLFSKATDGIIYGDGVLDAIAMGVMTSLGRTLAAIVAGALVTLTAAGRKPERWALIVATLYAIDQPVRYHWRLPPTAWDRLWWSVHLLSPAIACIAAAFITARLQQNKIQTKTNCCAMRGLAFLPCALTVVYIHFDIGSSHVLFNPIDLAAFLWLGMTCFHYRNTRTKGAAWLFAMFPVAFVEPVLLACLWISETYFRK